MSTFRLLRDPSVLEVLPHPSGDKGRHIVAEGGKETEVVTSLDGKRYCLSCTKMIVIGLAINCRHVRAVKQHLEEVR